MAKASSATLKTVSNKSRSYRAKKVMREIWSHKALYLMLLPAVLYSILFQYKPMYGILIAFKDYSFRQGIFGSPWVGFENFGRLFESYWFPITIANTLTISFMSLAFFPVSIIFALMLDEVGHEGIKRTIQTVSYAPHFISVVVLCGMLILFVKQNTGIINLGIKAFGGEPIDFMQKPWAFKWLYVLSGVWQGTGWGAIIYSAALSGVDKSLLEAAEIDGASRLQKMIHIKFPVLVPTIMIMLILQCGSLLSVGYEKALLLQTDANLLSSEIISTYVYKVGMVIDYDFSYSTANQLLNSAINSLILITVNSISRAFTKSSLF